MELGCADCGCKESGKLYGVNVCSNKKIYNNPAGEDVS
jgi:hypothetical protein